MLIAHQIKAVREIHTSQADNNEYVKKKKKKKTVQSFGIIIVQEIIILSATMGRNQLARKQKSTKKPDVTDVV